MKKPNAIQIIIPEPCTQTWDAMTPNQQGRHCDHCSKTVIDFTSWSDTALYNFFSKDQGHVCGRFCSTQLDRNINIPYQPHSRLYRMVAAMGLTLLFTQTPSLFAQNAPPKTQQSSLPSQKDTVKVATGEIGGTVLDEKREPLVPAAIQVYKDGILVGGNITDYDGNYTIKPLEEGSYDVLVRYVGFDSIMVKDVSVSVGNRTTQNFTMKHDKNFDPSKFTVIAGRVMSPSRPSKEIHDRKKGKANRKNK